MPKCLRKLLISVGDYMFAGEDYEVFNGVIMTIGLIIGLIMLFLGY